MPKPRSPGLVNAYGLKLGTGSWSASVAATSWGTIFAINAKSFLPSTARAGVMSKVYLAFMPNTAPPTLNYRAAFYNEHTSAITCEAAWEYIAASKPPEIWIEKDTAGNIVQVWRSEREEPRPPIVPSTPKGRVIKIKQTEANRHPLRAGELHADWDYDEKKQKLKKKEK